MVFATGNNLSLVIEARVTQFKGRLLALAILANITRIKNYPSKTKRSSLFRMKKKRVL